MLDPRTKTRPPAVAGQFYPAKPDKLRSAIQRLLSAASAYTATRDQIPTHTAQSERASQAAQRPPKALIVPHAGYVYSGPIAAAAYARIVAARDKITRVVLLGPAHRVAFHGLAAPSVDFFETPLGQIPIAREAIAAIARLPGVSLRDDAHAEEHSLEVQLPFLQEILGDFHLVPLVVGRAEPEEVAAVLEALWGGLETLVLISSDLSHYENYATAQVLDEATARAIEALKPLEIAHDGACGFYPLRGLLTVVKRRGLSVRTLDLRNSGDTAGPRDRVVGYGAWAFEEDVGAG